MNIPDSLVASGKYLHTHGLVIGSGGNISERDKDHIYIKKLGADMSSAGVSDYIRVPLSLSGDLGREIRRPELSSETLMHMMAYLSRNDISGVAHTHSPFAIAAAERFETLESPSYEFDCLAGRGCPVISFLPPGSAELAEAVSEAFADGVNAVILKRHGVVAVGKNIHEACVRTLAVERAAMTALFSLFP